MDLMLSKCICFFHFTTYLMSVHRTVVIAVVYILVYLLLATVSRSLEFGCVFLDEINRH